VTELIVIFRTQSNVEATIVQRHAVHIGADFDTAQAQRRDFREEFRRALRSLQRHEAESVEAAVADLDPLGQPVVQLSAVGNRIGRVGPITEQFGHRRDRLRVHPLRVHVLDTA